MQKQKLNQTSGGFGIKAWHIAILVALLAGYAIWHSYNVIQYNLTVHPAKTYEEVFENRIAAANGLEGYGRTGGSFDLWIHFKCPTNDMQLKNRAEFEKKGMAEEGRRFFAEKRPDDAALQAPITDLELFYRSVRTVTSVKNQWLLHNTKTGDYYYREWGY